MKNFEFCDIIKVFNTRFDISCKKVYFHGLPSTCPVLNNAEAFVGRLIITWSAPRSKFWYGQRSLAIRGKIILGYHNKYNTK